MSADQHAEWRRRSAVRPARAMSGPPMQNAGCDRIHCRYEPTGIVAVALFAACSERGLTHKGLHRHGIDPKRTDDTFGQTCRIAFASLRQTDDFFSDRCRHGSLTV